MNLEELKDDLALAENEVIVLKEKIKELENKLQEQYDYYQQQMQNVTLQKFRYAQVAYDPTTLNSNRKGSGGNPWGL